MQPTNATVQQVFRHILVPRQHSHLLAVVGGSMRWKAPELLSEEPSSISKETDVYAFANTCLEILNYGEVPWAGTEDTQVQELVRSE